jgi:protein SCO1
MMALIALVPAMAPQAEPGTALPRIGTAPAFVLTTQDGARLLLGDLHGKVVVITFLYTVCADTCPILTEKLVAVQEHLGAQDGPRVFFIAITVDPERDTPAVLKHYAQAHGVDLHAWAFLTGTLAEIRDVAKRYGVFYKKSTREGVEHTFLTSLVDPAGILRVQYLGVRFDSEEMLRDLQALVREERVRERTRR